MQANSNSTSQFFHVRAAASLILLLMLFSAPAFAEPKLADFPACRSFQRLHRHQL